MTLENSASPQASLESPSPYIFFVGLVAGCMGVLNSLRHFAAPALAPTLLNATMIGFRGRSSFVSGGTHLRTGMGGSGRRTVSAFVAGAVYDQARVFLRPVVPIQQSRAETYPVSHASHRTGSGRLPGQHSGGNASCLLAALGKRVLFVLCGPVGSVSFRRVRHCAGYGQSSQHVAVRGHGRHGRTHRNVFPFVAPCVVYRHSFHGRFDRASEIRLFPCCFSVGPSI